MILAASRRRAMLIPFVAALSAPAPALARGGLLFPGEVLHAGRGRSEAALLAEKGDAGFVEFLFTAGLRDGGQRVGLNLGDLFCHGAAGVEMMDGAWRE